MSVLLGALSEEVVARPHTRQALNQNVGVRLFLLRHLLKIGLEVAEEAGPLLALADVVSVGGITEAEVKEGRQVSEALESRVHEARVPQVSDRERLLLKSWPLRAKLVRLML